MLLLLLFICVVVIVSGSIIKVKSYDFEEVGVGMIVLGVGLGIVFLMTTLFVGIDVTCLGVIDEKIAMYQEENAAIECQIAEVVQKYQQYETDIFTEVAPEDAVTLVALYPELKSDTLVQQQIDVYIANNQKIKELKEQKIDADVLRWWLYFGGEE
jgi:hypothetical protein